MLRIEHCKLSQQGEMSELINFNHVMKLFITKEEIKNLESLDRKLIINKKENIIYNILKNSKEIALPVIEKLTIRMGIKELMKLNSIESLKIVDEIKEEVI